MNLPKKKLLDGCVNREWMGMLIDQAEKAISRWETVWSPFMEAPIKEEALKIFLPLNDLYCFSTGGIENAERHRICFSREENSSQLSLPIEGLTITGNFLFDKAIQEDFQKALFAMGINSHDLGDLWIIRDRGAQLICTPEVSNTLHLKTGKVRDVIIKFESTKLYQLQLPAKRLPKKIKSVEASTRLDAIASAGFGISRAKIVNQIKEGKIRLNWKQIKQANKSISIGDLIHLEQKGSIKVMTLELTKRERWRVELLRQ